jgi:hypothetical protein
MKMMQATVHDYGSAIRVSGIDAPETRKNYIAGSTAQPMAEWAGEQLDGLMKTATHIKLQGSTTYGRYTGTPLSGSTDLARKMVAVGAAMAQTYRGQPAMYGSAEEAAYQQGLGMWGTDFFRAVKRRKDKGEVFSLYNMRDSINIRQLTAGDKLTHTMIHGNFQMAKVRDQQARNIHVMPGIYASPPEYANMGRIWS